MFLGANITKLNCFKNLLEPRWGTSSLIAVSAINALTVLQLGKTLPISASFTYALITLIFIVEIYILFKGDLVTKLAVGLITPLHIMAIKVMIMSWYGIIIGSSYSDILDTVTLHSALRVMLYFLLLLCMVAITKVVEPKYSQVIQDHPKRVKIFAILETLLVAQIIILSVVMSFLDYNFGLNVGIFITSFISLAMFYMGIFMTLGFEILESYQWKSSAKASDSLYKNMLVQKSVHTLEIDCSTQTILSLVIEGKPQESLVGEYYDTAVYGITKNKLHPDEAETHNLHLSVDYMRRCASEGKKYYDFDYRLQEDDGSYIWYKAYVMIEQEEGSDYGHALVIIHNIQHEKELLVSATTDSLSGLYNKQTTEDLINEHLAQQQTGALFMIDVDNFKAVNDNLGHDMGDHVIQEVASKLHHVFDTDSIVGRVGGDEFMVFMKHIDDTTINEKAVQAGQLLYTTYSKEDIKITISASIGVCKVSADVNTFQTLYKAADNALYHSKRSGKNRFTVHTKH